MTVLCDSHASVTGRVPELNCVIHVPLSHVPEPCLVIRIQHIITGYVLPVNLRPYSSVG